MNSPELIHDTISYLNFAVVGKHLTALAEDDERFAMLSPTLRKKLRVEIFLPQVKQMQFFGHCEDTPQEEETIEEIFAQLLVEGKADADGSVMLLKAVITAFPSVSLPFLAVPLLSHMTVAIRSVAIAAIGPDSIGSLVKDSGE
eukprot:SAG22_NODE_581_length_8895_cov_2.587767_3_plen_144_part_00